METGTHRKRNCSVHQRIDENPLQPFEVKKFQDLCSRLKSFLNLLDPSKCSIGTRTFARPGHLPGQTLARDEHLPGQTLARGTFARKYFSLWNFIFKINSPDTIFTSGPQVSRIHLFWIILTRLIPGDSRSTIFTYGPLVNRASFQQLF